MLGVYVYMQLDLGNCSRLCHRLRVETRRFVSGEPGGEELPSIRRAFNFVWSRVQLGAAHELLPLPPHRTDGPSIGSRLMMKECTLFFTFG